MDFTESTEHRDLRAAVAAIASGFGPQYYAQHAAEHTPCEELWTKLGEAGFIGVNIPAEYGGGGGGLTELALVCEELGAQGTPLLLLVVSAAISAEVITRFGTGEQRAAWLPGLAAGTSKVVFAITEPDAGSNTHRLSTTATRDGDEWVLRGTKYYISGVDEADALLVVARTGPAPSLPHDELGLVDLAAYGSLIDALESGRPQDFERIILGGPRPLVDPQSSYAFVLDGADSHALSIPPAPTFVSAEQQSEAAENYWQALLRDVPFNEYETSSLARAAAADLSRFSDFRGPKVGGRVTPGTLFRWEAPGTLVGPYVSQFLLLPVPYGVQPFAQQNVTRVPGDDRLTEYAEWLAIQNGSESYVPAVFDPTRRFMRNGRDLAEYVRECQDVQPSYNAALIIQAFVPTRTTGPSPLLLNPGNPYVRSRTQIGFGTFGTPDAYDRLARAVVLALKAVFFQKWLVHRRLRPEEYGGRVQTTLTGTKRFPLGDELLASAALPAVFARYGTYLSPQAYPEGCPIHPSYAAAHAAFIGASVTMVKAFFNEDYVIPNPMVVGDDGLSLVPFVGPPLTVGGELNKLAMDVAFGRNLGGVHWRSDSAAGLQLGEAVAIRLMTDLRLLYTENYAGLTFTRFDGTKITV